jgi:hypothetical protein
MSDILPQNQGRGHSELKLNSPAPLLRCLTTSGKVHFGPLATQLMEAFRSHLCRTAITADVRVVASEGD